MKFTWTYKSYCNHCGGFKFNVLTGFIHDVRCWSWKTAVHNVKMHILQDLGYVELETDRDYLQRMGLDVDA